MQSVFIELTKYIFAFLMAFYVLSAYRGAIIHKEEKRKGIYIQQYIIIFAIHFLGYYVLYPVSYTHLTLPTKLEV